MKKVLIITYYWPPSGGPGVQRMVKLARYLPEYGIEPVVVTVEPSVASYPLRDDSLIDEVPANMRVYKTKTREIANVYTQFLKNKNLPSPGFSDDHKPGLFKRLARFIRGNYFIPDARIGWNRFALKQCNELLSKFEFSAILTSSPPHSTQLIGLDLSKSSGIPWIADLRDPWADIYYNKHFYRRESARAKDMNFEKQVLENAHTIVTVSESLKKLFLSKSQKINPNKIQVIPNGYDLNDFSDKKKKTTEHFVITYAGTMSIDYPVKSFIKAIKYILSENPGASLQLNLVGQVSDGIVKQFIDSGLHKHLIIEDYVRHNDAIARMQESSVLLLIIPDVVNNEGILTGKLFEYIAARKPVICFGPLNGDAAKIITECNSGKTFSYSDFINSGYWLDSLYKSHVKNDFPETENENILKYSRQNQAKQFAQIIQNIS